MRIVVFSSFIFEALINGTASCRWIRGQWKVLFEKRVEMRFGFGMDGDQPAEPTGITRRREPQITPITQMVFAAAGSTSFSPIRVICVICG